MSAERGLRERIPETTSWFVWDSTDQPLAVRMSASAIDEMALSVKEAFKSVPKRGLETGGLLLGRVVSGGAAPQRPVVVIEDFEPVDSEHQHGPSWLLSAADRLTLEESLDRWRKSPEDGLRPVGFFRSHTRPDFAFDAQDNEIFRAGNSHSEPVFLLIRPSHTELPLVQIGIRKGDALTPAATFPLSVPALQSAGLLVEGEGLDQAAERPETGAGTIEQGTIEPEEVEPEKVEPSEMHPGPGSFWAGSLWAGKRGGIAAGAAMIGGAALALMLLWPPEAAPVKKAVHSAAVIQVPAVPDGQTDPAVPMGDTQAADAEQAKPLQDDTAHMAPEPVWQTAPSKTLPGEDAEEEAPRSKWVPFPQPSVPRSQPAQTPAPQTSPSQPWAAPPPTPAAPAPETPVRAAAPDRKIESSVSADPVRPSRAGRILKTLVPLRWAGFTSGTHSAAPQALVQVKPSIPPALARRAHDANEAVDVKVQVLANGHVSRADLVAAPDNSVLAEPARVAARQWVFEPARVADHPVASSVIIHFRLHEIR